MFPWNPLSAVSQSWRQRPGPWLWAGGYLALIYLTLPVAPAAEKSLFALVDKGVVLGGINFFLALAGFYVMATLVRGGRYATLLLLPLVLAAGWFFMEGRNPVERVHIMEYGLLALLIHRACGQPEGWGMVMPLGLTLLAGCVDELIQGVLPNRYADIWDVFINFTGAALALWFWSLLRREPGRVPLGLSLGGSTSLSH